MFSNIEINEICSYVASLLFTSTVNQIESIKTSAIDTQASLLSEVSSINNDIQDTIEFNCSLIVTEYIDYLNKEIEKINSITMDYDTASDLVEFIGRVKGVSENREGTLFKNMSFTQSKMAQIVNYDINKSVALKPISQSKTTDFILSVKERLTELNLLCSELKYSIKECDYLIEACCFSKYYIEVIVDNFDGVPPLLEESYERIITGLSAEYSKWKRGNN